MLEVHMPDGRLFLVAVDAQGGYGQVTFLDGIHVGPATAAEVMTFVAECEADETLMC